jgi:hypothetical protein
LPLNTQMNAVATGSGTISRGIEESYGTSKALYNGQVAKSKLTSSASNATTVSQTLTLNGVSDSFDVTTAPLVTLSATYRTGASHSAGNVSAYDAPTTMTTYAGVPNLILVYLNNFTGTLGATLGGDTMTVDAQRTNGTQTVAVLRVTPSSAGSGKTLHLTAGNMDAVQWDLVTLSAAATFGSSQYKDSNTIDPQVTASVTVGSGGIAVGKIHHSAASATAATGCVEIGDRANNWIGTRGGTGTFGCNTGDFTSALGIVASYIP